jgi:hypothetical protein
MLVQEGLEMDIQLQLQLKFELGWFEVDRQLKL